MSYHRRRSARYPALGDIASAGVPTYQISGDPIVALIAQINRFADRTVGPGSGCGNRNYLPGGALPLVPMLDDKSATTAVVIVGDRYSCVPNDVWSKSKSAWATSGLADPTSFVMSNLNEITVTIAQFADSLGLDVASVGITQRDPNVTPKFPIGTVILLSALAIGAVLMTKRSR